MKPKSLIFLVVVLVVLAGLVVWKKTSVKETTIQEQVGLVTLLPEGVSKTDIAKLELYSGAAPDKKLTLQYKPDGEKWIVASHFNSNAKDDVVDTYLDSIMKIKGEPRDTAKSESDLDEYELSDAKAFHVEGFKNGSDEPLFHLLIGEAPAPNSVFIRKAGSNDVFVEDTNLRQEAGIYSRPGQMQADASAPKPDKWLDKLVVKIDPDKIDRVALTMPDKSLVAERHEVPKPEKAEAEKTEPGGEEAAPATPPADEKPEYEWKIASGGPGTPMKENGVKMMRQKYSYLEATDVVDPAKKADWGLDSPAYTAVIGVEGGDDVRLEAGRPEPGGDGYIMVAGDEDAAVYKISKYIFDQIFPKGSETFELPGLAMDKQSVKKVEVTQPKGNITIIRDDEGFRVAAPKAALEPQRTTAETLAHTVTSWKPADYADEADLGAPTKTISVTGGGESHTIKLYGPARNVAGIYATLDENPMVLVMSDMDASKIFVEPGDLYVRTLLNIDDVDIAEIRVSAAGGEYAIGQGDDGAWTLTADGTTAPADSAAADRLAGEVSVLQAEDILFGRTRIEGATETLTVKMKDGTEHVVTVGPEKDGNHEVKISGKEQVFLISADSKKALFPPAEEVKKAEPPEPPAEKAEEGAAAEGASAEGAVPIADAAPAEKAEVPAVKAVTIPATEAEVGGGSQPAKAE